MAASFYKRLPGADDHQCDDCGSCMEACESKSRARANHADPMGRPDAGGRRQLYLPPCLAGALRMEAPGWSGQLTGEW